MTVIDGYQERPGGYEISISVVVVVENRILVLR